MLCPDWFNEWVTDAEEPDENGNYFVLKDGAPESVQEDFKVWIMAEDEQRCVMPVFTGIPEDAVSFEDELYKYLYDDNDDEVSLLSH